MIRPSTHHIRQDARYLPQITLRCLLLIAAALLPGTSPGFSVQRLVECEAPMDATESAEGAFTRIDGKAKIRRPQPQSIAWRVTLINAARASVGSADLAVTTGHRLPNNLMAPLRL